MQILLGGQKLCETVGEISYGPVITTEFAPVFGSSVVQSKAEQSFYVPCDKRLGIGAGEYAIFDETNKIKVPIDPIKSFPGQGGAFILQFYAYWDRKTEVT